MKNHFLGLKTLWFGSLHGSSTGGKPGKPINVGETPQVPPWADYHAHDCQQSVPSLASLGQSPMLHCDDERQYLPGVQRFWQLLCGCSNSGTFHLCIHISNLPYLILYNTQTHMRITVCVCLDTQGHKSISNVYNLIPSKQLSLHHSS